MPTVKYLAIFMSVPTRSQLEVFLTYFLLVGKKGGMVFNPPNNPTGFRLNPFSEISEDPSGRADGRKQPVELLDTYRCAKASTKSCGPAWPRPAPVARDGPARPRPAPVVRGAHSTRAYPSIRSRG